MSQATTHEHIMPQIARDDSAPAALEYLRSCKSPRKSITGVSNVDESGLSWTELAEQLESTPDLSVHVGLDWVKVFIYGTHENPEQICDRFEALKAAAKQEKPERYFQFNEQFCMMESYGIGKGANHLDFFFRSGGVDVAFADLRDERRKDSKTERPIALVEMKGSFCYGRHYAELLQEVDWWACQLGLQGCEYRLSRVDIAIDVKGRAVKDSEVNRVLGGVVTRATDDTTYRSHGKVTGVQYGGKGSATQLVIYDKARELNQDPGKRALYESAYGPIGDVPITRYEYRMNRDGLNKNRGISTTDELATKIGSLIEYLTHSWYRETVPDEGERPDKREVLPTWEAIRKAAIECVDGICFPVQRPERPPAEMKVLIQQAAGCITSACASLNVACMQPVQFIEAVFDELVAELTDRFHTGQEKLLKYRAYWDGIRQRPKEVLSAEFQSHMQQWQSRNNEVPIPMRFGDLGLPGAA